MLYNENKKDGVLWRILVYAELIATRATGKQKKVVQVVELLRGNHFGVSVSYMFVVKITTLTIVGNVAIFLVTS